MLYKSLLDSQFRIPGTDIRFGLDPIIGLIPGLGDVIGYIASATIVLGIVQKGVSGKVIYPICFFSWLFQIVAGVIRQILIHKKASKLTNVSKDATRYCFLCCLFGFTIS